MPSPSEPAVTGADTGASVEESPATGEQVVATPAPLADRLGVLDGLRHRPLVEHAEVYQGLHADLQAALAEIDSA